MSLLGSALTCSSILFGNCLLSDVISVLHTGNNGKGIRDVMLAIRDDLFLITEMRMVKNESYSNGTGLLVK